MYLLPCVIWVHVLPVHVLLHKIQMSSRLVRHVLDVVLFCCVSLKLQYLTAIVGSHNNVVVHLQSLFWKRLVKQYGTW